MRSKTILLSAVFYAGLAGLTLLPLWRPLQSITPPELLSQIGRNIEAYVFALLAAVYFDLATLRTTAVRAARTGLALAILAAFVATEALATQLQLPQSFITLNEAFLGLLIIIFYSHWSRPGADARPLASRQSLFYTVAVVVPILGELPIKGWESSLAQIWIVDHAETWGFVILTAMLIDFVLPWPPAERMPLSPVFRGAWYLALLAIPLLGSALNRHGVDSAAATGLVESSLVWIQRITEAFVAALALTVWLELKYLLRSRGDRVENRNLQGARVDNR